MSTLREAAHALRAAIQRHCQAGEMYRVEAELTALFLAADAPEPGQEELQRKLEGLYGSGFIDPAAYGIDKEGRALIVELRAMWPRRDEDA